MNIKHLVIGTGLFLILTPGAAVTLPPGKKGVFTSLETSKLAIALHTLVFLGLFALFMYLFKDNSGSEKENTEDSENSENTESSENTEK